MIHTKIRNEVKSPIRYPGGKTRAIKSILPMIPDFDEFRDPFMGGMSVPLYIIQRVDAATTFRVNDIDIELYSFWSQASSNNEELVDVIRDIRKSHKTIDSGKKLYYRLKELVTDDPLESAVRYFVLNRITFSGNVATGGFSKYSFQKRFTESSIERLEKIRDVLQKFHITNLDYEKIINLTGDNVFIFLDPPYFKSSGHKLYGRDGKIHVDFDHERFAQVMKRCSHKWLITYDDCSEIRDLFDFATIKEWSLQYSMNNYRQKMSRRGNELFIYNYHQ